MRAALYLRISLDKTGKRAGVERQRTDCEALCERRGWSVADVFEDNSISAYSGTTRPAYERLVAAVAAAEVDVVVAWHTDRLWRNVVEQQTFLAIGRDAGLRLVATPSNEVNPADADDDFLSTVLAAAAQKESADKSRRMRRRQAEKAERGEYHGGRRSYGYRSAGVGLLKIVPAEAAVIRDAARRVLAGDTMRSIVLDLIRRGVRTTEGREWRVDTLAALLVSPRIAGLRRHNGGSPVTAMWEPIVDVADHERLVALAHARRTGPRLSAPRKHLLTGLLRCSRCGSTLAPNSKEGTPRYVCRPLGNGGCGAMSVVMSHADARAVELVVEHLDSAEFGAALARARKAAEGADRQLTEAVDQLQRDRHALAELDDAFADGLLDRDRYRRQVSRLQARIGAGETKVASLASSGPAIAYEGQGATVQAAWEHMTLEEKRQILEAVVERFVVAPAEIPRNVWRPERLSAVWRF